MIVKRFDKNSSFWVVSQQILLRGCVAIKFLLAARLLGPESVGVVGVALLTLAIVESLSETGLMQASIQRKNLLNPMEAGALLTLQSIRGIGISLALACLAKPISLITNMPDSFWLIILCSVIPLLRNSLNPGYFIAYRDREFLKLSVCEISAAILDLTISIVLILVNFGPASIIIGTIISDVVKLIFSWTKFRFYVVLNNNWKSIKTLTDYGKWIWGTSIITLILNQMDKIIVAIILGPSILGIYQVATKIAQLIITDGVTAFSQFLFPSFSSKYRDSKKSSYDFYIKTIKLLFVYLTLTFLIIFFISESIVSYLLGSKWDAVTSLIKYIMFPMSIGAIISIQVAFIKAIGRPSIITKATIVQLTVVLILIPFLAIQYKTVGLIATNGIGALAACFIMWYGIRKTINKAD